MLSRRLMAGLTGFGVAVASLSANTAQAVPTAGAVATSVPVCATAELTVKNTGPADGKQLRVDVNPNLSGKKSWRIVLQQKKGSSWRTVSKTRTKGKQEVRTWNKPSGTYRVRVLPGHDRCGATSNTANLRRPKATAVVSADSASVKVDVTPDIGRKSWKVRLERRAGSSWELVEVKQTRGSREIVKFSVRSGTYRVKVLSRYGYDTAVVGRTVVRTSTTSGTAGMTGLEYEIFTLTNAARSVGRTCGSKGFFGPAPALKPNVLLANSARAHSKDMADNGYFAHRNLQGLEPWDRVEALGYSYSRVGENIAAGFSTAKSVVDGWLASPGHCEVLMTKEYTELGVGHYFGSGSKYGNYFTQNYGTPR